MNWRRLKRDLTPAVLGMLMIGNFIISVSIAVNLAGILNANGNNSILAVVIGGLFFAGITILLLWISSLIMDEGKQEKDGNRAVGRAPRYASEDRTLGDKRSDREVSYGEIEILSGLYQGGHLALSGSEHIIIGSDPRYCQLVMGTYTVSARHCTIGYNQRLHAYEVRDDSDTGIFFEDGSKVPSHHQVLIKRGSVIQIGFSDNYLRLA